MPVVGASGALVFCPMALFEGVSLYIHVWPVLDLFLDSLNTWDILWARELSLYSSPCLVAYSSEIEWDSSALLSDLHQWHLIFELTVDFLLLLGVSQHPRRLGAAMVLSSWLKIVSSLTKWLWGVLELSLRESWIDYSSGARGLEDSHLVSRCVAPAEGLTPDSQLAHDPSSGRIAITRTSLPGSKWTSIKKILCHLFAEDFMLCMWLRWLIGSLDISLLINVGITILAHFFAYLSTLLVV
jgi:hypothetical protein